MQGSLALTLSRGLQITGCVVLAAVAGCSSNTVELPGCWEHSDFKPGLTFSGKAIIESNPVAPPLLFPVECERVAVIAKLPSGTRIGEASENGRPEDSMGAYFYKATIRGTVTSETRQGSPYVIIEEIKDVTGVDRPSWINTKE